jgi:hypothetical protein
MFVWPPCIQVGIIANGWFLEHSAATALALDHGGRPEYFICSLHFHFEVTFGHEINFYQNTL